MKTILLIVLTVGAAFGQCGRVVYNPFTYTMDCLGPGGGAGTVTSIATTSPITGGTITATGTIACATCVTASSPGAGVAHFAGGTQAATSSNVVAADFGNAITARTAFGNNTAAATTPAFNTTSDVLAYQTAEIPAYVFVTSDFTTSGSGTALEAITGLTWTMPGSTALNIPFSCRLIYHQNSATAAVAFGTQNATTAPTNYAVKGTIYTSATVFAAANVVANTATSAVSVVSGTPSAITTNWNADLDGFIEQPSGTASVFTIRVSTATQGDTVTVKRGSFCTVGF